MGRLIAGFSFFILFVRILVVLLWERREILMGGIVLAMGRILIRQGAFAKDL